MILDREFPHDTRVEHEMASLKSSGHSIYLACFTRKNLPAYDNYNSIVVYRKKINTLTYKSSVACLRFPVYFNFWTRFLFSILKKNKFDAIHIHDLPLSHVGFRVKKKFNIPLVIDLHENWPAALEEAKHTNTILGKILSSNIQWRRYEEQVLKKADRIVTVVEEMRDRIAKLGIQTNKISILPNTIKPESFIRPALTPDPNYLTLFYAGGVNIHRGLQIVIDGLVGFVEKYPFLRLWIIGPGSYIDNLKTRIEAYGITKSVVFFGWRNLHEISELLSQSDIALIPHLKSEQTDNSSPNKLYQYMYFGKPILASNCNSIERVINETKTGIVYRNDQPNDFADKLEYLISQKDKFKEFSVNGQKAVQDKYNWDLSAQSLINLYENL
jgi:glycosyltransferase involved in cell wall biosynthesis